MLLSVLVALAMPLLALAAPLTQKGDIIPIAYGDTVSGTITSTAYEAVYSFEGQAGDVVTITMTRADDALDPYLVLYDAYPSQNPLASDDDGGGGLNARIAGFSLPASGTYYIVATRYGRDVGTTTGSYILTLQLGAPTPDTGSGGAFGGLPVDGSGQGGTGGQELAFSCDGVPVPAATLVTFEDVRPGFTYRVTVLGLDGFDPVIALEAEDGSGICNDDEPRAAGSQVSVPGVGLVRADNLTAQIQFTTGGAIGDIFMRIGGFGGRGGRYVAVFEGLAIAPSTEQDAVTLNVSEAVMNEPIYVYMVSELAGLDPFMRLAGTDIICDDAGVGACADTPPLPGGGVSIANGRTYIAGQFDAGIGVVPRTTGDLTFIFESYQGRSSGNYAMIVIGSAPGATDSGGASSGGSASGGDFTPLSYGQQARGVIDDVNWAFGYTFNGQAGDNVSIVMEAANSNLDPYLALADANENILAQDDDSAGRLNARIDYTLPASGTYYIVATRFGTRSGTSSGAFILTLTRGGPGGASSGGGQSGGGLPTGATQLSYGNSSGGVIDNANWFRLYTFNGRAGDTVVITMVAAPNSNLDPYLGLLDASNNVLAEDDDSGGQLNSQITYRLRVDGTYTIFATRYGLDDGTSSGAYTLTLQRR